MQEEAASQKNIQNLIAKGYEAMIHKPITPAKSKALEELYRQAFASLKGDKIKTCEIIGTNDSHNNPETAALVVVANAMLNLDEVITKN
jgi:hypothetical protein